MLVLTRKVGQQIIVGQGADAVTITVVALRGQHVRLGVTAPRQMTVHRDEVQRRIEQFGDTRPRITSP